MLSFLRSPASLGGFRRAFCTEISEASKAELMSFLKAASRPKLGLGKAKQSSGQKALDLTRQAKMFDDLDLPGLLRLKSADLKKREVPCQVGSRPRPATPVLALLPAPSSSAVPHAQHRNASGCCDTSTKRTSDGLSLCRRRAHRPACCGSDGENPASCRPVRAWRVRRLAWSWGLVEAIRAARLPMVPEGASPGYTVIFARSLTYLPCVEKSVR